MENFLAQQMASQAEFIVNTFQETHDQHDENIDVYKGVYDCDSSGFVGFVLEEVALRHFLIIPKEADQPRPRAFECFLFFTSADLETTAGCSVVPSLLEARRSDIMTWRPTGFQPGDDTGHVFFVAEKPSLLDSGMVAVRPYDSAAYAHFDDTRAAGESGVGSGFINFGVDDAGVPVAFQFGPSDPVITMPIVIGRIEAY